MQPGDSIALENAGILQKVYCMLQDRYNDQAILTISVGSQFCPSIFFSYFTCFLIILPGCASGKNHSLFVSNEGNVYSLGDGRKGQLGYGNPFTINPMKGGIIQSVPRSITPTGDKNII